MFEHLKEYKKIVVTGCQRSGTRIGAKCIANDLGYKYIDEHEFNTENIKLFKDKLKQDNVVIYCPSLAHICHTLGDDVAVVFMFRDKKEIEESMAKIDWKKRCLRAELNKYKAEGNIVDIKNNYWKYFQKDKCNSFELKYNDLKKHKLFISKEERDNLKEKGKWIWRSTK